MTTWSFALYTFLVMVAGPVHQESLAGPLVGLLRGPTAARKIIRDRRASRGRRGGYGNLDPTQWDRVGKGVKVVSFSCASNEC